MPLPPPPARNRPGAMNDLTVWRDPAPRKLHISPEQMAPQNPDYLRGLLLLGFRTA